MIATVLLIAFTVVIGGIVSLWLSTLTTTTTGTVGTQTGNQTKCAGAYIKVDRISGSLIIFSNPTTESITSILIIGSNGTSFTPGTATLTPGQVASFTIARTATNTTANSTYYILKGLCLGTPIEGTCRETDSCWV